MYFGFQLQMLIVSQRIEYLIGIRKFGEINVLSNPLLIQNERLMAARLSMYLKASIYEACQKNVE